MNTLARKTKQKTLLLLRLIVGALVMAAALVVVPIAVFSIDLALLKNLFVWLFVVGEMLFFGLVGWFCFMRPFLLFCKTPDVQAETDGKYLYIHGKKEAKIPLSAMKNADVDVETPTIMGSDFLIHLLSEHYGDIKIRVQGHGKFKLRFVAEAQIAHEKIASLGK